MQAGGVRGIIFWMLALTSLARVIHQKPESEVDNLSVNLPIKHLKLAQVSRFAFDLEPQDIFLELKRSKRRLVEARKMGSNCWPSLYDMLEELKKSLDIQIELRRSLYPFRPSGQ